MKKLVFAFVLLLFSAGAMQAQSCDCDTTPFQPDPPCFSRCTVGLLASVGLEQLIRVIGIRANVAYKIVDWPYRSSVRSFQEYSAILTEEEMVHVASRINSLSHSQIQELRHQDNYSLQSQASAAASGRDNVFQDRVAQAAGNAPPLTAMAANNASTATTNAPTAAEVTYSYHKNKNSEWRWKVKAADGRVIAESKDSYKTERECLEDIERVKGSRRARVTTE
jgi:uncharacterized protein YegP (UPF0339 family)